MLTAEPKAYGSSWYAATRVASPPRAPADRRARRRRLRDRRGACRPHRGARGGAARLVGAWCWRRRASPGAPRAATPASCCRDLPLAPTRWSSASGSITPRRCGRCRRRAPNMCATPRATCRARRLTEGGWLHVSKTDDDARAGARGRRCSPASSAPAVEPWPADRVREALHSPRYFGGLHYPRGFAMHPLNYALGLAAAAEARRRAHLRGHAGAGDRSGRRAKAHRHAAIRACAPRMSCWPATCIWRNWCRNSPTRCCRCSAPSSSPRRSARRCTKPSAIPAR